MNRILIEEIPVERIEEFWKLHIRYLIDDKIISDEDDIQYFQNDEYREIIKTHMLRKIDKHHMVYFTRNGDRIGAAQYNTYQSEDGKCFLLDFWVFPPYRGGGVGHQCFEALKAYTIADGARYYEINCEKENAHRFWLSLGFADWGVDEYDMPLMQLHPAATKGNRSETDRKYYEAYDDRYRQIHKLNLQWFYDDPTPIIAETLQAFQIVQDHKILELGCGEGRDAYPLLRDGYHLLATDISEAAIKYAKCKWPQFADKFAVLDCVAGDISTKFDFIYAVAVVHMLVKDTDRDRFYTFIRNHLNLDGIALICTMGDGETEWQTDIRTAFDLRERTHEPSGKIVQIANTSCRMVNFETFHTEIKRNGLEIIKEGTTAAPPDFPKLMYAIVKK